MVRFHCVGMENGDEMDEPNVSMDEPTTTVSTGQESPYYVCWELEVQRGIQSKRQPKNEGLCSYGYFITEVHSK